jgi:hypothetical protein
VQRSSLQCHKAELFSPVTIATLPSSFPIIYLLILVCSIGVRDSRWEMFLWVLLMPNHTARKTYLP